MSIRNKKVYLKNYGKKLKQKSKSLSRILKEHLPILRRPDIWTNSIDFFEIGDWKQTHIGDFSQ